jgi:glutaconate CoA-transferase, subunit A
MPDPVAPLLFANPSANHARARFRERSRAMTDKVTTVAEAVGRLVSDGDYLAIGGFGTNRIPTAVCHEIVRQRKQNLAFAGHTSTHDFQLLCAGNLTGRGQLLSRLDAAYIVGLEARGLSPHARRVMESGQLQVTEWTNYALAVRLRAAAQGVSFLPYRTMLGTDTVRFSAAKEVVCPFTGEKYLALPALYPDAAAIHVHEADRFGNCRIKGVNVADSDLARAAHKLIITCERLIPNDEIRRDPTQTVIPFYCVDAVCEVPFGSFPGNMAYEYFSDEEHLRQWLDAEEDEVVYRKFLEDTVLSKKDFGAYLYACGGLERMQKLRQQELLLHMGR